MGLQLRELASWAQSRKLLATFLVMLTLSIGILIGTLVSGRRQCDAVDPGEWRDAAGAAQSRRKCRTPSAES